MREDEGLALFDAAHRSTEPVLVPARLDLAALGELAGRGALMPLLRGLVRTPAGRPGAAAAGSLAARLAALPPARREAALLEVVRAEVARVLGYPDPSAVGRRPGLHRPGPRTP